MQPQVAQSPPAQPPEAVSLPEPVPDSTEIEAAPLPSTPPPSPETQHAPVGTAMPAQKEVHAHQEPEENSESDIQDIGDDTGVLPEQVERANNMVRSVVTPQPFCPTEQSETDSLPSSKPLQTITEVSPPQRPPSCQTQSNVTNQSSFLTRTPEKAPVQDTTPPVEDVPAAVLEPEEASEPQTAVVSIK